MYGQADSGTASGLDQSKLYRKSKLIIKIIVIMA